MFFFYVLLIVKCFKRRVVVLYEMQIYAFTVVKTERKIMGRTGKRRTMKAQRRKRQKRIGKVRSSRRREKRKRKRKTKRWRKKKEDIQEEEREGEEDTNENKNRGSEIRRR